MSGVLPDDLPDDMPSDHLSPRETGQVRGDPGDDGPKTNTGQARKDTCDPPDNPGPEEVAGVRHPKPEEDNMSAVMRDLREIADRLDLTTDSHEGAEVRQCVKRLEILGDHVNEILTFG